MSINLGQAIDTAVFSWEARFAQYLGWILLVAFGSMFFYTGDDLSRHRLFFLLAGLPFLAVMAWRPALLRALLAQKLFQLALLLVVVAIVTTVVRPGVDWPGDVAASVRHGVSILLLISIIFYVSLRWQEFPHYIVILLAVSGALASIIYVGQHIVDSGGLDFSTRPTPTLSYARNPIPFGTLLVTSIICSLALLLGSKGWQRISLYSVLLALALPGLILTQSRGAFLPLVVVLAVMAVRLRLWPLLALGVALVGAVAVLLVSDNQYRDLLETRNIEIRLDIYAETLRDVRESPLLGRGWVESLRISVGERSYSHSHNTYLSVLLLGGVVGLVCFLMLLIYALGFGWKESSRETPVIFAAFGCIIAFSVSSLTDTWWIYRTPHVSWVTFWLPYAVLLVMAMRQRPREYI